MRFLHWFFFFLIYASLILPLKADGLSLNAKTKIALVLSGGAAYGYAHLGVIKWLEQNRIPIDLIVGTSMGGLIGGAYAMGLSPEKIEELAQTIKEEDLLSSEIAYKNFSLMRKKERQKFPAKFKFGLKNKNGHMNALLSAHQLELFLSKIGFPYGELKSFDDLPIPFRCMAVDFEKGEEVILEEGYLSDALRATMSIPALFPPVRWKDKLLVDGGVLNNLPSNVAKSIGANIVIAVDVTGELFPKENLHSLSDIANQTITIMMAQSVRANRKLADVLIVPQIKGVSTFEFDKGRSIISAGFEEAQKHADKLMPYALNQDQWKEHLQNRLAHMPAKGSLTPGFVKVQSDHLEAQKSIEKDLSLLKDKPLAFDKLDQKLTQWVGTGQFASFGYKVTRENEKTVLLIESKEKSQGNLILSPGVEVLGNHNEWQFNGGARLTKFDLGKYGSESYAEIGVGTDFKVGLGHRTPIQNGFFWEANAGYQNELTNVKLKREVHKFHSSNYAFETALGYAPSFQSEIKLGYKFKHTHAPLNEEKNIRGLKNGSSDALFLRFDYDAQNSPWVPTKGLKVSAESKLYLHAPQLKNSSSGNLPLKSELHFNWAVPLNQKSHFSFQARGGTINGQRLPLMEQFALGGPFNLSALLQNELHGQRYLYGNLGYLYKLGNIFNNRAYAGIWYEWGKIENKFHSGRSMQDLLFGVIADSHIGPLFFGASIDQDKRWGFQFGFGGIR